MFAPSNKAANPRCGSCGLVESREHAWWPVEAIIERSHLRVTIAGRRLIAPCK